jgi:hypothetical protein
MKRDLGFVGAASSRDELFEADTPRRYIQFALSVN